MVSRDVARFECIRGNRSTDQYGRILMLAETMSHRCSYSSLQARACWSDEIGSSNFEQCRSAECGHHAHFRNEIARSNVPTDCVDCACDDLTFINDCAFISIT
eukprot:1878472-Pleurochrysis_carterae.AAC.2